jgi:toxin CptA
MHSAPPVNYPLGRSRFAAALLLLLSLLGGAVTTLWWFHSPLYGWRSAGAFVALAAAAGFAAWQWWHSAQGTLAWDGATWMWKRERLAQAGVLEVSLDLQHWLLLRWTSGNDSHWFWLDRARCAERWDDLRRAVYSRAGPQALPGARLPAAKP